MPCLVTVPGARKGHAQGGLPEPATSPQKKRRGHQPAHPPLAAAAPTQVTAIGRSAYGTDNSRHLVHLCANSPIRPINWRWQLAGGLAGGLTGFPEAWIDAWVQRARRFREALDRCRSADDRAALARRQPDLAGAFALAGELGWGKGQEVEARLLARQPVPLVATRFGLTPAIVDAYEHLFFNISDRLHASSWVVRLAIGPALHGDPALLDLGTLARHVGFFQGQPALDALLDTFTRLPAPEPRPRGESAEAEQVRRRIRVKLWVANFLLAYYCLRLLPPPPILRLAARRECQLPLAQDDASTIQRLRSSVPHLAGVSGPAAHGLQPGPPGAVRRTAAVPRLSEVDGPDASGPQPRVPGLAAETARGAARAAVPGRPRRRRWPRRPTRSTKEVRKAWCIPWRSGLMSIETFPAARRGHPTTQGGDCYEHLANDPGDGPRERGPTTAAPLGRADATGRGRRPERPGRGHSARPLGSGRPGGCLRAVARGAAKEQPAGSGQLLRPALSRSCRLRPSRSSACSI